MEQKQEPIQQLNEIRNLMERSSRFISLSGFSGIFVGIIALIGSGIAYFFLDYDQLDFDIHRYLTEISVVKSEHFWIYLILDALIVLALALFFSIYFTTRKAREKGLKVWDPAARRMVINLLIPLTTGGIFCLILLYHNLTFLVVPATLIFYGLALLNASKYTFYEVRLLGITEVTLGLLAAWLIGYALLLWAIGFGVIHILYGLMMYIRYEAKSQK